ncbi:hypothetical protein BJX70DRAFT_45843 [Aspergillus crustosus]
MANITPEDEVYNITDDTPRMLLFGREKPPHHMICEVYPHSFVIAIISPNAAIFVPSCRPGDALPNIEGLTFFLTHQLRSYYPNNRAVMVAVASRCVEENMPDYVAALRTSLEKCRLVKVVQWYEVSSAVLAPHQSLAVALSQDDNIPACTVRGCAFPISIYCGDQPPWAPRPRQAGASLFRIPARKVESSRPMPPLPNWAASSSLSCQNGSQEDNLRHPTGACEPTPSPLDVVDEDMPVVPALMDMMFQMENEESSSSSSDSYSSDDEDESMEISSTTAEPAEDTDLFGDDPPSSPRPTPAELEEFTSRSVPHNSWDFSILRR